MRLKTVALALGTVLAVGAATAACGEPDKGTVSEVQTVVNRKADNNTAYNLIVKLKTGERYVDGPYLTKKGIGACRVGSGWPSCLTR